MREFHSASFDKVGGCWVFYFLTKPIFFGRGWISLNGLHWQFWAWLSCWCYTVFVKALFFPLSNYLLYSYTQSMRAR